MAEKKEDPFPSLFERDPVQAVLGVIEAFASGFQGEESTFLKGFDAEEKLRLTAIKTKVDETREGLAIALTTIKAANAIADPKARQEFLDSVVKNSPKGIGQMIQAASKGKTQGQLAVSRTQIATKFLGLATQFAIPRLGKGENDQQFIDQLGPTELIAINEKLSDTNPNKLTPEETQIFTNPDQQRLILNTLRGTSEGRTGEEQIAFGKAEATAAGTRKGEGPKKVDVGIFNGRRQISFEENGKVTSVDLGKAPPTQRTVAGATSDLLFAKEGLTDLIKDPGVKAAVERGDLPESVIDSLLEGIKQNNPNFLQQLGVKLPGQDKKATGEITLSDPAEELVVDALEGVAQGFTVEKSRQALAKILKKQGFSPKERKDALDKFVRDARSRR